MKAELLTGLGIFVCILIFLSLFFPLKLNEQRSIVSRKEKLLIEWEQMLRKYLRFPLDHGYGSHTIVLLAALFISKSGPILELGMGPSSTPLLHYVALHQNRSLVSADSDIRWVHYFANFTKNNRLHQLRYINVKTEMGIEWAQADFVNYEGWRIVFIDHRPGSRRRYDLMFYSHRSDLVVLHDTENSALYQYNVGLAFYSHRYRFTKLKTYTDVLSSRNETLIESIRYILESTPEKYFSNRTLEEIL